MAPLMPKGKTDTDTVSKEPSSCSLSTFPHYKLGDLGLIPRPAQQYKSAVPSKLSHLSHTTRLGMKPDAKLRPITPQRHHSGLEVLAQTTMSVNKLPPLPQNSG